MDRMRSDWLKLRYDYYVSGRILMFNGMLETALLMLSYAIESSMKSLISEHRKNEIQKGYREIRNTHNLKKLFDFILSYDICNKDICSEDFLKYISYNFVRYPMQIKQAKKSFWNDIGSRIIDVSMITYFDDLMIKIDSEIAKKTDDPKNSVISSALRDHDTYNGRVLFHQNFPASVYVENLLANNRDSKINDIWNADDFLILEELGSQEIYYSSLEEICSVRSAINFELPKQGSNTWQY